MLIIKKQNAKKKNVTMCAADVNQSEVYCLSEMHQHQYN